MFLFVFCFLSLLLFPPLLPYLSDHFSLLSFLLLSLLSFLLPPLLLFILPLYSYPPFSFPLILFFSLVLSLSLFLFYFPLIFPFLFSLFLSLKYFGCCWSWIKTSTAGYTRCDYIMIMMSFDDFLDAPSHLYMRLCPSVGPSVRPSVRMSRVIFDGRIWPFLRVKSQQTTS